MLLKWMSVNDVHIQCGHIIMSLNTRNNGVVI